MKAIKVSGAALALALPLALAACGGGTENTNTTIVENTLIIEEPMNGVDNGMAGMPAALTGQQFADTAAASDAYEVAAGNLAREKATTQALKDFGAMMVTAHTDSTAKVKAAAAKATPAITPSPALTAEQEANLATLRDATGADFDNAYKSQQVAAHTKALELMQGYAASGDVPELKAAAGEIAPVVQQHLTQIQGM